MGGVVTTLVYVAVTLAKVPVDMGTTSSDKDVSARVRAGDRLFVALRRGGSCH